MWLVRPDIARYSFIVPALLYKLLAIGGTGGKEVLPGSRIA